MAVEYIEIREKQYPVMLGYSAYKKLQKKHQINMEDIHAGNMENYEYVLFYALESGAKEDDVEFKFKLSEMEGLLNDCLWRLVALMPSFFPDVEELAKTSAVVKKKTKPPTGQTREKKELK